MLYLSRLNKSKVKRKGENKSDRNGKVNTRKTGIIKSED